MGVAVSWGVGATVCTGVGATVCTGVGVAGWIVVSGEGLVVVSEIVASALVEGSVVGSSREPVGLPTAIKPEGLTVGEPTELLQLIKTKEMTARKLRPSFELKMDRCGRKENITRSPVNVWQ